MNQTAIGKEVRRRYSRNIMLQQIGIEGQEKLLKANVLIVGCGALGTVAAMYLGASGVGALTLVDFDTVDLSNLQRQLSFSTEHVGMKKAHVLAQRLRDVNPSVSVRVHDCFLTPRDASSLIQGHTMVVEGSDNPDTKYMIADACKLIGVPCVTAGIREFHGQVTTFIPGHANYRDFFPDPAGEGGYTPCSLGGVLGPLPGIIGSIQAAEVIKHITGAGRLLTDRLLLVDALTMDFTTLTI